ncbi:hypothetical protein WA158_008137 [Blastocystis sp. Blastoise]
MSWNATSCIGEDGVCRYKEELTNTHLYTITIVFSLAFIVYFMVSYYKTSQVKTFLDELPRRNLNVGRDLLSKKMKKAVAVERANAKRYQLKPHEVGDPGYKIFCDDSSKQLTLIHLQTVISQSYISLQDHVTKYYPTLKKQLNQTVREYIDILKVKIPNINIEACDNYIETYELATFSSRKWTSSMFDLWYANLNDLMKSIETSQARFASIPETRHSGVFDPIEDSSSELDTPLQNTLSPLVSRYSVSLKHLKI